MTRTSDLRFRKPPLYPAELRDRDACLSGARSARFIAEPARDRKPPAVAGGAQAIQAFGLFLIGDVLQHEAGELRHQRPQPGVLLE